MTDSTYSPETAAYFKQWTDAATFADKGSINGAVHWNRIKVTHGVHKTSDGDFVVTREQLDEIMGARFMRQVDFWVTKYGAQ